MIEVIARYLFDLKFTA